MSLILPGDSAMMQQMQQKNPMIQGLLIEINKSKQISGFLEKLLVEAMIHLERTAQSAGITTLEVSPQLTQWWTTVKPQLIAQQEAQSTTKTQTLSEDGNKPVEGAIDAEFTDVPNKPALVPDNGDVVGI